MANPKNRDKFKKHQPRPTNTGFGKKKPKSDGNENLLYGLHSVIAGLNNPKRKFKSLYATQNTADKVESLAKERGINLEILTGRDLENICGQGTVHQGIVGKVYPLPALDIRDIEPQGLVVVLDQLTDPHNVGAILRTAAAFNVQAIVTQDRNSPQGSAILAKTASGGMEHVPIIEVTNLARAMDQLKKINFTLIGLDSEADQAMADINIPLPLAIVLGAEGKGLRHKTRQNCDLMARLDMPGQIKSLNVSNAAAICLYALHGKS